MTYTLEEKKKIERVLEAFDAYIQESEYFDIVYSAKMGYIQILTEKYTGEENAMTPIESCDHLLKELFFEISSDVRDMKLVGEHKDVDLFPEEIIETKHRVEAILNTMTQDREYCLEKLDYYLEHVNN